MSASLGWNSSTPENYLKSVMPSLLDAHVFGICGFNLDGTRIDHSNFSAGKALIDFGQAESNLDLKRLTESKINSRSSAESTLLRILTGTDDVEFNSLTVDDFAVSRESKMIV